MNYNSSSAICCTGKKAPRSGVGGFYNGWNEARLDTVSTRMLMYGQWRAVLFRRSVKMESSTVSP
eukprot:1475444-Rhodomonas_salina.1